ncbi:MAG: HPF/RaiA family ribosome-associated protein [Acidobacteria bacterium]|nr:HPF/RaiA family ribosome-associated protein [Acidobacteriota bacterium]
MKIEYTGRGLTVDTKVQEIVDKKISKLAKVLPGSALKAHTVVRKEKKGVSVEITVAGKSQTYTAKETADDQATAAYAVLERLETQARKSKTKVKEVKKRQVPSVREPAAWAAPKEPKPVRPRGPRRETLTARPAFEEDAVSRFLAEERDVLIYRDANDESIRVLYRKKDGTVGLVVPR